MLLRRRDSPRVSAEKRNCSHLEHRARWGRTSKSTLGITFAATPIVVPSVSEGSPTEGRFAKQRRKRPRAGRGVFKAILSPEGRRRQTTFQSAPTHHTPRSACGLSFKGTSLGLRLDLTASRAGPAWGKGGSTFTGRRAVLHSFSGGGRPSQPDREKALTHHQNARKRN